MIFAKKNVAAMAAVACLMAGAVRAADAPPAAPSAPPAPKFTVKDDGTIVVPSFELPFSFYASPEARQEFIDRIHNQKPMAAGGLAAVREATSKSAQETVDKEKTLYPHTAAKSQMAGVPVETFVPAAGVAPENKDRVLIELHGGAFVAGGGGPGGAVESIPIAVVGRIKVIAVDYRQGPENKFPAGSEDVAAVYRELLKTYKPQNIGIFGCSAGGMLTAETIPWFLKEKLPLPGAIGIFCASTDKFGSGDSFQLWTRLGSVIPTPPKATPTEGFGAGAAYFGKASDTDPLAVPAASKDVLKAFPPTLILTGTRAPDMSAAVQSHLDLVELGVKSQLLLFDGLDHGFFSNPALPESRRAYGFITRFFAENLGGKHTK